MKLRFLILVPVAGLLAGCSTMNSNFSCNVAAGDSCLTIEQVDAMTRFADENPKARPRRSRANAKHQRPAPSGALIRQNNGQSLWVAKNIKGASWA